MPRNDVPNVARAADPAGRVPDFFLVGAPRCGTTAMYSYLRSHPGIFMPERKEPCHLCPDLDSGEPADDPVFIRDRAEYLALFQGARADQVVGEACVFYLYSAEASERIHELNPAARILAMIRNPVDMIHSLHAKRLLNLSEDIPNFEKALDAEPARKAGKRMPANPRNVKALFYREIACYSEQLERYFSEFGRERVRVVVFDDFERDTARIYRDTLEFVGADPTVALQFDVVNANIRPRVAPLHHALTSPTLIERAKRLVPRPLHGLAADLVHSMRRANEKPERREPMDPGLRRRLEADFAPEIERLSRLLGRDLAILWSGSGDADRGLRLVHGAERSG